MSIISDFLIVPPSHFPHQPFFAVQGRIHQLHGSARGLPPPHRQARCGGGSTVSPAYRGSPSPAGSGGQRQDRSWHCPHWRAGRFLASCCSALGQRLLQSARLGMGRPCSPAAAGRGRREPGEERGKRGCTHRRLLQTGERSLKGCPAGVGSGAGVAAGALRTALTASGRRRGPYPQTRPLISHNSRRREEKWEVGVGEANHPLPTQRMVFLAWNRLPFVLCCQNV